MVCEKLCNVCNYCDFIVESNSNVLLQYRLIWKPRHCLVLVPASLAPLACFKSATPRLPVPWSSSLVSFVTPSFPFLPSHCRPSECLSFSPSLSHLPPEDHHFLLNLPPLQHPSPLAQQLCSRFPRRALIIESRPTVSSSRPGRSNRAHPYKVRRAH
jgi:hypothetical protein